MQQLKKLSILAIVFIGCITSLEIKAQERLPITVKDSTATFEYKVAAWLVERAELSIHLEDRITGVIQISDSLRSRIVIKDDKIATLQEQQENSTAIQRNQEETINLIKEQKDIVEEERKQVKIMRWVERVIGVVIIVLLI